MAIRSKVKLAYIANSSARRATFQKRQAGLLKKAAELSTLCGVEACAVVYGPYSDVPVVHPQSSKGAIRVLKRFGSVPQSEKAKKMVNQEGFLRQRVKRATAELKKVRRQNKEKETTRVMLHGISSPDPVRVLEGLSAMQLKDLGRLIDRSMKDIDEAVNRINMI